jgi:hypothetical protein
MKSKSKKKSTAVAAKRAAIVPVAIELNVYPHVLHVHRNGQECPPERVVGATPEIVAQVADKFRAAGHAVTVVRRNAQGGVIAA